MSNENETISQLLNIAMVEGKVCSKCNHVFDIGDDKHITGKENEILCSDCFNAIYIICDKCNMLTRKDETEYFEREYYCESCQEEHLIYCYHCESTQPARDSVVFQGNRYCVYCADDELMTCHNCGSLVDNDNAIEFEEHCYCPRCATRYLSWCGDCETYYRSNSDCPHCNYDDDDNDDNEFKIIKKYHHHKYNFRHIGNYKAITPYMGFELEVEYTKDRVDIESAIDTSIITKNFLLEEDGSLKNGVEIISHALTYKEHMKRKHIYKEMLTYLRTNSFKSHDTKTCGFHVHISRAFIRGTYAEKFMANFVFENKENLEIFARRGESTYALFKPYSSSPDTRYRAVNISSKTIELRFFKGTLNYTTFMATIQFCRCLYLWSKTQEIGSKNYSWKKFIDFIEHKHKGMNELKTYLTKHNINN